MSKKAVPDLYLEPGDFRFGEAPAVMRTILGSCVTVTLWHPKRRIGGMCHFMLPGRKHQPNDLPDGRYADEAFALFDQAIARTGTRPAEYVAKLFGGGNMFMNKLASTDLGNQNIDAARRLMKDRGIAVAAEHVGGSGHRKLVFDLSNGEIRLSHQKLAATPWRSLGQARLDPAVVPPSTTMADIDHALTAVAEVVANIDEWSRDYRYSPRTNEYSHRDGDAAALARVRSWFGTG